ncbi:hypothetical protein VMZ82_000995 [Providencia rettgeri]|uniref:hypothetical protein n=1 Tax=Providencia rettgeri TaxID=587 RepID=UPI0023618BC1|nr:hypothetical protein [Providencia rettgeri]EMC8778180.1 hypothetical protein [Providencia rettgeri]
MSIKNKLQKVREENEAKGLNDPALFKQRLLNGDFGLAKTFWLFWFIPILLLNIWETLSGSTGTILRIDIVTLVWSALCVFFVSKTQGNKVWKVIALIIITLDAVLSALALVTLI